jgi:hypothetical protein
MGMTKAGRRPDNYMTTNTYHFRHCHFVGLMCDTCNNNCLTNIKTKRSEKRSSCVANSCIIHHP